jgi:tetratricopeptide (TPR) repeat protein
MCYESSLSLVVKTKAFALESIRNLSSGIRQGITASHGGGPRSEDSLTPYERFERYGDLGALEQGISEMRFAMNLMSSSDPRLPSVLGFLGAFLLRRFEQLGSLADANDAIEMLQRAVNLVPDGDSKKPMHLNNLGICLRARFERQGNLADLDHAILQNQLAISLALDGNPGKPMFLSNLGSSFLMRFIRTGNPADLDYAIRQSQAALDLTPNGHPDRPMQLSNLGSALQARYDQFGNIADVDNAILRSQEAATLTPDNHINKAMYLSNLGGSFGARFRRLENIADLDSAITQVQAAVNLTPDSHPSKASYLNNLASMFGIRYERLGKLSDIDNAVAYNQSAVNLTPNGHPDKPGFLNNLGSSLQIRCERLKNRADIDDAIAHNRASVNLMPDGHPKKPMYLNILGISLQTRFEQFGNLSDLEDAIEQKQAAINSIPDHHPSKTGYLINLSHSLLSIFRRLHQPLHAEMAISNLSLAAMTPTGPPSARFIAVKQWISLASTLKHSSLLTAYECALGLIPLVAWLGLSIADRHQHLAKIGGIARDAAAAAISLEQYDKALEWLEQGRSIVWTQILQLRTPVDRLYDVNPDLANRILQTARLLEQGSGQSGLRERKLDSIQEEGRQYRALTMEWESIIEQVRSLPDFEDFLRSPSSHRLMNAAKDGPVVVLNIATERCDALVLVPELDDVIHIPLPNITSNRVTELRDELKDFLYSNGMRSRGQRAAMRVAEEANEQTCYRVLAELWTNLVHPVLNSLAFSVSIFWGIHLS